jgi:hypothetical protein
MIGDYISKKIVRTRAFYHQINLAFFYKKAFKHQVTKKKPKTQKKDYFFLRDVSVRFVLCVECTIAA